MFEAIMLAIGCGLGAAGVYTLWRGMQTAEPLEVLDWWKDTHA